MENKVLDGLQCCIEHGTLGGKSCRGQYNLLIAEDTFGCPYRDCDYCVWELARDAFGLIEQLEDSLDHLSEMYSDLLDRYLEDMIDEED